MMFKMQSDTLVKSCNEDLNTYDTLFTICIQTDRPEQTV